LVGAGLDSVRPIDSALSYARSHHAATVKAAPVNLNGPLPSPPDSPGVAAAKVVARQAAIIFAPPLLLLWFGWDLWFAAVGFLELHSTHRSNRSGRSDEAS
jgi:hypothetical protein